MISNQIILKGLSETEVSQSRDKYGNNSIEKENNRLFRDVLRSIVFEPMFILLLAACIIYFLAGQFADGIIMLVSIFIVSGISLYQEYRSQNAIDALRKISASKSTVIRNGITTQILTEEIVVDDILLLEEGQIIAADGLILSANDL